LPGPAPKRERMPQIGVPLPEEPRMPTDPELDQLIAFHDKSFNPVSKVSGLSSLLPEVDT